MGTYLTYDKCYNLVESDFPELTTDEARRAKMNELINNDLAPQLSQTKLFSMLERNALTDPPHRLPQYSKAERAQRKARSQAVREAAFDFLFESKQRGEGFHLPRSYQQLVQPVDMLEPVNGDVPSSHNREIAGLFSLDTTIRNNYETEVMQKYLDSGLEQSEARERAQREMSNRRTELVMNHLNQRFALLDHLDEMIDPNLPPEQLAQNYRQITQSWEAIFEIDNYIRDAESGHLLMSEDQLEHLRQMQTRQDSFVDAREKLHAMSNPVYEYLDPDQLRYFDLDDFEAEYDATLDVGRPNPDIMDDLSNIILDYKVSHTASVRNISEAYQQALADHGFDSNTVSRATENRTSFEPVDANDSDLVAGKPVAVSQGDKVMVLSRVSPDSDEITMEHPGRLFDQTKRAKTRLLTEALEEADPLFLRSSKQFKAMKESLRQVSQMAPLGDNPSEKDIARARRELSTLLRTSTEYRATKGAEGKNDREQARIDVADQIKEYAQMKLDQLNTIEKAQRTLAKYRGMTSEQIRALDAQESREAEAFKVQRDAREKNQENMQQQMEGESAHPTEWSLRAYPSNIKPMRGEQLDASENAFLAFTDKHILGKAKEYDRLISEAKGDLSTGMDIHTRMVASDLLRDCVIYNIVQMERTTQGKNGPGNLEKMLQDPKKLKSLQVFVSDSLDFAHTVTAQLFSLDKEPSMDIVPKLIADKEPQRLARSVIQAVAKEQQAAQSAPAKAQPQRQQDQPQKKPMQPQK